MADLILANSRIISKSPEDTRALGIKLANKIKPGAVIFLLGDLGGGKTTFVKGLAKGLGIKENITSPTFSILRLYEGTMPLVHADLYRIAQLDEDLTQEIMELARRRSAAIIIEWAEKIRPALKPDVILTFHHAGINSREIEVEGALL